MVLELRGKRKKLPNKELSFRRRSGHNHNLTADDQVKLAKVKKIIAFLLVLTKKNPKEKKYEKLLRVYVAKSISLSYSDEIIFQKVRNRRRTIASFGEFAKANFRFESAHLKLLLTELSFPLLVKFENKMKMSGEEVLLRGLFELVTGAKKHLISHHVFGRDSSAQSRAFLYFIDHIDNNWSHLVTDNLEWWFVNGFWAKSAEAIGVKMAERYPFEHKNLVSHFIDCNCLPTTVTGGGPAENGANSARWDENIQRSFFNLWKSLHGLKHQTVDNAYGLTEDIAGPVSLRNHDIDVCNNSMINDRFAEIQLGQEDQYIIFGDSAYLKESHMSSYHKERLMLMYFKRWNKAMKHVRISIEWNYGYTGNLFNYVRCADKFKQLQEVRTSKVYRVATLFRNFNVIFYGGQSSKYFGLEMPPDMILHYIRQTNIN
jgi:hypothetical protein